VAAVTWGPACHGRNRDRLEAHPLLTRARTLAERLGITVPYALPGLDEASLDLDV